MERRRESRSMAGGGPKSDCSLRPPAYGDMGLGIQTKKLYMIIRSTPYIVLDLQNGFGVVHEEN